jgi:hypothetical protein
LACRARMIGLPGSNCRARQHRSGPHCGLFQQDLSSLKPAQVRKESTAGPCG